MECNFRGNGALEFHQWNRLNMPLGHVSALYFHCSHCQICQIFMYSVAGTFFQNVPAATRKSKGDLIKMTLGLVTGEATFCLKHYSVLLSTVPKAGD